MRNEEVWWILNTVKAIQKGHFVLDSGLHTGTYINKDRILSDPSMTSPLALAIAAHFRDSGVEVVAGPTIAGAILAFCVVQQYNSFKLRGHQSWTKCVYAEEEEGRRVFRRGFEKDIPRKKVLVVDDVLTTGGTVRKVIETVRILDGKVAGVGVIINRGKVTAEDLGVPELFTLAEIPLETSPQNECPLCQEGIPLTKF